jgi:hypothetical protein
MFKTKLPSSNLGLSFLFDLSAIAAGPSTDEHDSACKKAAAIICHFEPALVRAWASSLSDLTLQAVHHADFDPEFHNSSVKGVRFEFFYDPSAPRMGLRITTYLGERSEDTIDGHTAVRIGLRAMDILEGKEPAEASSANRTIPPFTYGLRNRLIFWQEVLPSALFRVAYVYVSRYVDWFLGKRAATDPTLVNDAKSLFRYYESSHAADPALYAIFRDEASDKKPFHLFLDLLEAWRASLGLVGYFFLVNFSPLISVAMTSDINDIISPSRRYARIMAPPGCPPPPPVWRIANIHHARTMVINNYGAHRHGFSATLSAFIWDWLELAAPLNVAGCITVNGVFSCFVRGTPAAVKRARNSFSDKFGLPVAQLKQNMTWFKVMGKPASIA